MPEISYANCLSLSSAILAQFTFEMCVAPEIAITDHWPCATDCSIHLRAQWPMRAGWLEMSSPSIRSGTSVTFFSDSYVCRSRVFSPEAMSEQASGRPVCKQVCRRLSPVVSLAPHPPPPPDTGAVSGYVLLGPDTTTTSACTLHNYTAYSKPPANCY